MSFEIGHPDPDRPITIDEPTPLNCRLSIIDWAFYSAKFVWTDSTISMTPLGDMMRRQLFKLGSDTLTLLSN